MTAGGGDAPHRHARACSLRFAQEAVLPADGLLVTAPQAPETSAGAPAQRRARNAEPELYDFRRPMTLARDHGRRLEMAFERFARMWGTQLTSRLRALCSATCERVELMPYDEYVGTLPGRTAVMLCTVEQTRQTALLQTPVETVMVWVDYLFGGTGLGDDREGRELTDIELTVVRELLQPALDDLRYAFATVAPLSLSMRAVQYSPQFVQAVPASDAVLVARFALHTGARVDTATLMVPAENLLAAMRLAETDETRSDDDRRDAAHARAQLEVAVTAVPMDVVVRFAPVTVRPPDVVGLAVGDVLPLQHPATRPLDVVVDEVVLARAAVGSQGSRLACRVVEVEEESA